MSIDSIGSKTLYLFPGIHVTPFIMRKNGIVLLVFRKINSKKKYRYKEYLATIVDVPFRFNVVSTN